VTFQEAFKSIPEADKAPISRGMIDYLCGYLSFDYVTPLESVEKDRKILACHLFQALRAAQQTHETGK